MWFSQIFSKRFLVPLPPTRSEIFFILEESGFYCIGNDSSMEQRLLTGIYRSEEVKDAGVTQRETTASPKILFAMNAVEQLHIMCIYSVCFEDDDSLTSRYGSACDLVIRRKFRLSCLDAVR